MKYWRALLRQRRVRPGCDGAQRPLLALRSGERV
jgi:hypothetical protein